MPEQLGTRYWTFLRYFAALAIVLAVVALAAALMSGVIDRRTYALAFVYLPLSLLNALALWRPRPLGWCFILATSGTQAVLTGIAWCLLFGAAKGWWTFHFPPQEMNPVILDAIASCAGIAVSLATFRYFHRRRNWFVPHDRPVTGQQWGLAALAAGVFLLLVKLLPPGL